MLNQEFLLAEGYRFLEMNTYADYMVYFLLETERVADLQKQYGDAVEIFGFEMCHEESLRERALHFYDPDRFKDHEATYGEPEGTVTVTPE
ncbi:hypothetical protein BRC81_12335 [Halobacteriales archaeon QS_1_68_20]|nr:MAG: hypothetical protein BRC81_12335 [Halobacteriales archaeon QS_1_68_20]